MGLQFSRYQRLIRTVRKKRNDEIYSLVYHKVKSKRPNNPLKYAELALYRYTNHESDPDDLLSSFKPILDGLIQCGVLEDDSISNISYPHFRWIKSKGKKIWVVVKGASMRKLLCWEWTQGVWMSMFKDETSLVK